MTDERTRVLCKGCIKMENNSQDKKKQQQKYKQEWEKEHYTQINFNVPKEKQYSERLKILSIGTNKSKNQLLIEAVEMLLEKYNA